MTYAASFEEVQFKDPTRNSHKFYRAYVMHDPDTDDARVLFQWGRIGARGQFQVQVAPSLDSAKAAAVGKLYDKRGRGYESYTKRTLKVVPEDLLREAGVNENARSQAVAALSADPFARLSADTDRLIRLVTGPSEVQAEAITLRRGLDEQLSALRTSLTQAEGSLELVDDVLAMKLGA